MRFIEYLIEQRKIYARQWSQEQIKSLPTLSANNLETVARVGNVVFDQEEGLGSVPDNKNVVYRGFVGMMYPRDFLLFAHKADRDEDAKKIAELIQQGYGIGSPFLDLLITKKSNNKIEMEIVGHEGRARCVALNQLQPNVLIPVHFFLMGGMRARHVDDNIIRALNNKIKAEGTKQIVYNKIHSIWLNGNLIRL